MIKEYETYKLGDMQAVYFLEEETRNMELLLLPAGMEYREEEKEKNDMDSLVQIKIAGDIYPGGYAGGRTLRQSKSVTDFRFEKQERRETEGQIEICTRLRDKRNYVLEHHLYQRKNEKSLRSYTVFINGGTGSASLELLSSFSLGKISPYVGSGETGRLKMHRIRSVWSMEGRLESRFLEELQLEPSWAGHAVRAERFGQAGSMPVNGFFPYLVIEDEKSDIFWGVQIAHNASWQMEIYRRGDDAAISGGLADRELGHWVKEIKPGERFQTPEAILSVCQGGGIDEISQRLTSALEKEAENGPESERELPLIFNEYCTTWGCPSDGNIRRIADAIRDKGFSYFVIDCGWYKEEGVPWDVAMGDYEVSKELFPEGLEKTVSYLKENGFRPGIWFEIDNVGEKARAYQLSEHLLKRDGAVLTTSMRRFWDMRQEWVQDYLTEKVIGTLKKYGFEYIKMDYNDTIGLGCDGAESLGEGLRENMQASLSFLEKIKEEIPGIILENCSSGGHKLEPLMMSKCSMASFSDAHECEEIPIIAANLHRVILPRQSQIWAVIRKEDSRRRIAYSIAAAFLGRLCLSGDVLELTREQWDVLDEGLAFYKKIAAVIKKGFSRRFGPEILGYRHPEGWQCLFRSGKTGEAFAVYHSFYGKHEGELAIPLDGSYRIEDVYSDKEAAVFIRDGRLICEIPEDMRAAAIYLKKTGVEDEQTGLSENGL